MDTHTTRADLVDPGDESEPHSQAMMLAVHDAFRRDLDRLFDAVTRPGSDDPQQWARVAAGWEVFRSQLHNHHTLEDSQVWPRLRARLEVAGERADVLDDMEAEHRGIGVQLALVDATLSDPVRRRVIRAADVEGLRSALCGHLSHEDRDVLPLLSRHMTVADQRAVALSQRRALRLRGAAEFFPWVLDGASPERGRVVLDLVPKPARVLLQWVWQPRYRRRRLWST